MPNNNINSSEDIKASEKKMELKVAQYRHVLNNIQDIIFETDQDGKILFIAGAYEKLLGRKHQDLLGKNIFELSSVVNIPTESLDRFLDEYDDAVENLQEETQFEFGLEIYKELRFFEVKEKIHYNESGNLAGTTGVIRDITLRKREEQELKKKLTEYKNINCQLRQYSKTVSHDLRQPLAVIKGWLQFLQSHYQSILNPEANKIINSAISNTNRMYKLIDHLLKHSQQGSYHTYDFESVDCEKILENTLENLGAAIKKHKAYITHDPLPLVVGDPTQLTQLFQNLIGNAIKFNGERTPQVHISSQKVETEWLFTIQDNGIGMDTNLSDQIFTMFGRINNSHKYEGFGIGLTICKNIVVSHGGRIWFESEIGNGSTFYFTIPER